jgi:hypothetical protein
MSERYIAERRNDGEAAVLDMTRPAGHAVVCRCQTVGRPTDGSIPAIQDAREIVQSLAERDALRKQNAELRAACKAVEWCGTYRADGWEDDWVSCPCCLEMFATYKAPELRTHHEGCQLAAALANGEDA